MVFAAAFLAGNGGEHGEQALKVARANEDLMCASYNLAAIYAQLGQTNKALALLKRHFFEYEKYDAVRSKEMMEARVDAVFASIVKDPEFLSHDRGRRRQAADAAPPLRNAMTNQRSAARTRSPAPRPAS